MKFDDIGLTLTAKTRSDTSQDELDTAALALFHLFGARDREFGFNPDITVEYPDISEPDISPFLSDPVGYVAERINALDGIGRVVVLTTFGDRIGPALVDASYGNARIDMPAGPDETFAFSLKRNTNGLRTLYLEAVNEADEKIRASFALELLDAEGELRGGACGSIHGRDGALYSYLATMTLGPGLPQGTGARLGEALFDFLREQGVAVIHLGTQTAGPFYEKLGFQITRTVLPKLRFRQAMDGNPVWTDLVMMERKL